jgi:hypothetical protein
MLRGGGDVIRFRLKYSNEKASREGDQDEGESRKNCQDEGALKG